MSEQLVTFPAFADLKLSDPMTVTMPVAYWLGLASWVSDNMESVPIELRSVRSLVLAEILTPREINEQLAHDEAHRENPFHGTPFEQLGNMFRFGPPSEDGGGNDPRMDGLT